MSQQRFQSALRSRSHFTSLQARGGLVAKVLATSWAVSPAPVTFSEEQLATVTPLLYQSGEAALAWWRIRDSALAVSPTGQLLRDAYRHLRLAARIHERELTNVFSLLRQAGIEPVLVKGWANARRYPETGLRPYGDIDLCVRPDQFQRAAAALKCLESIDGHFVDLHDGFAHIGMQLRDVRQTSVCRERAPETDPIAEIQRIDETLRTKEARSGNSSTSSSLSDSWDELFARSQLVPLGDSQVRILSDEDHLRIICLHLLRSGAWRPLWLCDVAVALETLSPDFNWNICLGRDPRQADWVASTISLAQELLGPLSVGSGQWAVSSKEKAESSRQKAVGRTQQAEASGPLGITAHRPPPTAHWSQPTAHCSWFAASVLRHWGRVRPADERASHLGMLLCSGAGPRKLCREIYARWDNPVRATVMLRGRFNAWPRLPYQLGELVVRSPELPRQVAQILWRKVRLMTKSAAITRLPLTD